MHRAARPRPVRPDDGANDTLLRDLLVYPLQVHTTTTDVVEVRVEGIGTLRNPCVAEE